MQRPVERFDAEAVIRAATGGDNPKTGDTLRRASQGWQFTPLGYLGILEADPASPGVGEFWFNSTDSVMRINLGGGTILASPTWT